jgi:tRNA-2-methylthio-N6-dimethylallyladenosine synthase
MSNTYHIITIGCQMNKSDSERIASYLNNMGYKHTSVRENADIVIITTCGVRQSAEDRVYGFVPQIKKDNPNAKIVISGCLAERKDVIKRLRDKVDIWLPIKELPNFSKKLGIKNKISSYKDYLEIKPDYNSKISAFVPIGNGCNNFCAYCVVPYARGREVYRNPKDIHDEVVSLVKKGYKEIILIAQNVNSYKSEIINSKYETNFKFKILNSKQNIAFPDLLKLINSISGNFWVRFATSHPKDMSDELIDVIAGCDKICEHIHLPAQAGDNEILKRMNRGYTREYYLELIKKIRNKIPNASITTDIIVGFPGETEKQFNNTIKLFKEVGYDMAYIAQYSPRPGTAAEKLNDNITKKVKKQREINLEKILKRTALENNKTYVNKTVSVLIKGESKTGNKWGETRTGKKVLLSNKNSNIKNGDIINTKILEAKELSLIGILV